MVLGDPEWVEELLEQDFPGVNGSDAGHGGLLLLVVVDDLDVLGPGVGPDETDAPLLVDPDAVLSGAVRLEGFEAVAGRGPEVVQRFGGVEHDELAQRGAFDPWVELLGALS